MHHPVTTIENLEVIGTSAGVPLHRWTEEGGTRVFEEHEVIVITVSGTTYSAITVLELAPEEA